MHCSVPTKSVAFRAADFYELVWDKQIVGKHFKINIMYKCVPIISVYVEFKCFEVIFFSNLNTLNL